MKFEIKKLESGWRELTITVPAEQADKDYLEIVKKYKNKVSVPGFRKGKAPLGMVEQLYFDYFKEEFLLSKAEEYYQTVLKENDLHPVNEAEIVSSEWEKGKEFSSVIKFQEMPETNVEIFEGLKVAYEENSLTEEVIDEAVNVLRSQLSTIQNKEFSEEGDNLTLEIKKVDSESEAFSREIILGDNIYNEELDKQLAGKKVGYQLRSKLMKENEENQELRDKEYDITIKAITEEILPELNDELAKDAGFDTLEELMNSIKNEQQTIIDDTNRKNKEEAIFFALIEANPIEIPEVLINNFATKMAKDNASKYGIKPEQFADLYKPIAENTIKIYSLKNALYEKLGIEVSNDDKKAAIKKASDNMNMSAEEYEKLYKKEIESEDFDEKIKEKKLLDYIDSKAVYVKPEIEELKETENEDEFSEEV